MMRGVPLGQVAVVRQTMTEAGEPDVAVPPPTGSDARAVDRWADASWRLAGASIRAGNLADAFALIAGQAYAAIWPHPAQRFAEAIVEANLADAAIPLTGEIHDTKLRHRVLGEIAEALAKAGQHRRARAAAMAVTPPDRDAALYAVAYWSSRSGGAGPALEAVGGMSDSWKSVGFAMIAAACAAAGDIDTARGLAHQAIEGIGSVDDDYRAALTLGRAALVQAKAGDRDEAGAHARDALARAERLPSDDRKDEVLQEAGAALVQLGCGDEALAAVDRLNPRVRRAALEPIALALVEAGEFQAAAATVQRLGGDFDRSEFLLKLAPALARRGQAALAVDSLRALEGDYYRQKVLGPLTQALVEAGAAAEAVASLTTVAAYYRREPTEQLIPRLLAAHEVQLAMDAADQSESHSLVTTVLKHLAKAAVDSGRREAAAIFSASPLPDDQKAEVLQVVALGWVGAGEYDLALEAARAAAGSHRSGILGELTVALFEAGEPGRARLALAEVHHESDRSDALSRLAALHLARGEIDRALEAARDMPAVSWSGARTETLMSVLAAALAGERFDLARDVAASVPTGRAKTDALGDVAFALARAGRREDARAVLLTVLAMSLCVTIDSVRDRSLGEMAQRLADGGRLDEALAVAGALRDHVHKAGVLRAVARQQAETDLDRAVATARSLEDLEEFGVRWIEADALLDIAGALLPQNRPRDAVDFAERGRLKSLAAFQQQDAMLRSLNTLVPKQLAKVYAVFAHGAIADPVAAIFSGREEDLRYKRDEILAALAEDDARRLDAAGAIRLALSIGDARQRTQALARIAHVLTSLGHHESACQAGALALEHAPAIDVAWHRLEAVGQAAEALIRAGDTETWQAPLSEGIRDADSESTVAAAVSNVALTLARQTHPAPARQWLERVPSVPDENVQAAVALTWATLGEMNDAVRTAERLLERADRIDSAYDRRTEALTTAAGVFVQAGRFGDALRCLAACDTDRDVVNEALREVVDRWCERHASGDAERDVRFWREACQPGADRPPAVFQASVATILAARGQPDIGALLMADAVAQVRLAGRPSVFEVLTRGAPALAAVDGGDTLHHIVRDLLDVEGWWESPAESM